MRQYLPKYLFVVTLIFSLASSVLASGFLLKTVGSLNVERASLQHLWYTQENVTFTGITVAGNQVAATIDGNSQTVTPDASGNWSFSTTLTPGDHQVSFSSIGSTISFTLTIGSDVPANVGPLSQDQTPPAGTTTPTLLLLSGGIILALLGTLLKFAYFKR